MHCFYHERVRRKRSLCFLTPKAVSVGDGEVLKQHEVPWNHCSCMGEPCYGSDTVICWD